MSHCYEEEKSKNHFCWWGSFDKTWSFILEAIEKCHLTISMLLAEYTELKQTQMWLKLCRYPISFSICFHSALQTRLLEAFHSLAWGLCGFVVAFFFNLLINQSWLWLSTVPLLLRRSVCLMVAIEGRGRFCKWPPSVNDMFPNVSLIAVWTSELASCFCSRVHGASWVLTGTCRIWSRLCFLILCENGRPWRSSCCSGASWLLTEPLELQVQKI